MTFSETGHVYSSEEDYYAAICPGKEPPVLIRQEAGWVTVLHSISLSTINKGFIHVANVRW
jgi:hypothetical protein